MPEQIRLAPDDAIRSVFAFGPFRLDVRRRTLHYGSQAITITPREFDALHILVAQAGRVVSKDELAWQLGAKDAPLSDASLAQTMYRLRKTLEARHAAKYVATIPRQGYQFVLQVASADEFDVSQVGSDAILYQLQRAKQRLSLRSSADDLDEVVQLLHAVLAQAPDCAPAYAALAEAHLDLAEDFYRDPRVEFPLLEQAAERALQLDSFQPIATCALAESAMLYHHDWQRALALLLQAGRSSARAQWMLSFLHVFRGEFERAKGAGRKLLSSYPSDFRIHAMMGAVHFFSGEPALAELYLGDAVAIAPREPYFRHMLAQALAMLNRDAEALELLDAAHANGPTPLLCAPIGYIAARLGDSARAHECMKHLERPLPECVVPYRNLAIIQMGLADRAGALDSLEAAYELADSSLCSLAVHPFFAALHGATRFDSLVQKLGLPNVSPAA